LPLVSSLEHSSTNVNAHAKTRFSGIFFSIYMIIAWLLFNYYAYFIPVTVLAGISIYYAYKLFSPALFKSTYYIGPYQFFMFVFTMISTLLGGVLVGIVGGFLSSLMVYLRLGGKVKNLFFISTKLINHKDNRYTLKIQSEALASNYLHLKKIISKLPKDAQIYLDFTKSKIVDYNLLELIYQHPYNYNNKEGSIELQGLEDHKPLSAHPLSTRLMQKKGEISSQLTTFTERQLDVWGVAVINNCTFRPNMTYDGSKLQGFRFALGYEIKYRENKFTKNFLGEDKNTIKIEFFDLFLSKGIRMSEQNKFLSAFLVTGLDDEVPNFNLTKENFVSRMLQSMGYEDINFENHEFFSESFLLHGENEEKIRSFFSEDLIDYLEKHPEFCIEVVENRLLIYREIELMTRTEMEDTLHFIEDILKIIYQPSQNLV
jgi:hypothetical protein